jgi:hypothetical protein
LIGGFLVVLIIVLAAVLARRTGRPLVDVPDVPCAGTPSAADVLLVPAPGEGGDFGDDGHRGIVPPLGAFERPAASGEERPPPTVPPQGQSPEDTSSP